MRLSVGVETPNRVAASLTLQESPDDRFLRLFFTVFVPYFCGLFAVSVCVHLAVLADFSWFFRP
jgi:hypothetical protein